MSIFPTKIILATDGCEEAELAATTAINLAKNAHSELHVLTVGPGYPAYDVRVRWPRQCCSSGSSSR